MKKAIKILRSIITSLLFLIMIIGLGVHLVFTCIKTSGPTISNMFEKEELLKIYLEEPIESREIEKVALNYIEDYNNYLFHKRSYPSLQTVDYSQLPEENISEAKNIISNINDQMNIPYSDITTIREANNLFANGAIYLLINVGILLIYLFMTFSTGSFKKSAKYLAISAALSGLLTLIGSFILMSNLPTILNVSTLKFLTTAIDNRFMPNLRITTFTYMTIGIFAYSLFYIYDKFIKSHF